MTNETIGYEAENILDDEIDFSALQEQEYQEQEYMDDLHMRYDCYLELIEEFEN